ncbi:MAG: [FeFe] hydrogenase H-cluster maturation GTPase HydF [Acidobacteria bacterium]|nr:[FeFe] hydrogenase H-cluster maturation GTPase HydF [Acidobacteriota bacterium]
MRRAPRGERLHIGILGRRNAGKSSVLNALVRQSVSIVSERAGTTTDPVEKPMELLPLGPVLFIDTAGLDDTGALGRLRVERSRRVLDRTDLAVLVADGDRWDAFETGLLDRLGELGIPVVVAFNKADRIEPSPAATADVAARKAPGVRVSALTGAGMDDLAEALIRLAPDDFVNAPPLLGDLVRAGDLVVLVTPIDKEAPRGRLILPQVQVLRDLLDHGALAVVAREKELAGALGRLTASPALVVTDSQAFREVAEAVPAEVPLTSFSILFARYRGDLAEYTRGAVAIGRLKPGDRVLVAEACTHHPIGDDIGRVKIPKWLGQAVGGDLDFTHVQGHDFPADLAPYRLAVQCGACMQNRREVLSRIARCRAAGLPVTNYGMAIAWSLGIFERALGPFPVALRVFRGEHPHPVA